MWRDPAYLLAAAFGAGLAPIAPGTVGTAVGLLIYLVALLSQSQMVLAAVVAGGFVLGVLVSERVTRQLGVEDCQSIVWDEVVGVWITLALIHPWLQWVSPLPGTRWLWIALAFGLFRVFDILKPWPIRTLERRVRGGLGVMLDDVLAGCYAGVLLMLTLMAVTRFT